MRKHRKKFSVKASTPNSDINVTPLVDVVLVMLIIFMVVTPLLEKDIQVRVPDTEIEQTPDLIPPDQLVVRVNAAGDLKINTESVPADRFVERLKAILEGKKPDDKVVFVSADEQTNYGTLVRVLDGAKQAGADTLGMATDLPPDKTPAP
jgi:biopolymer transport protein ExbD